MLALALLLAGALYLGSGLAPAQDDYLLWKQRFGFSWNPEEDAYRRLIFLHNLEAMRAHNADPSQTYQMGLNQFSALNDAEFAALYLNSLRASAASPAPPFD
jgi:hypothetical protein